MKPAYVPEVLVTPLAADELKSDPLFVPIDNYAGRPVDPQEIGALVTARGKVLGRYFLVTRH